MFWYPIAYSYIWLYYIFFLIWRANIVWWISAHVVLDGGLHFIDPLSLACPSTVKVSEWAWNWKVTPKIWLNKRWNLAKPIVTQKCRFDFGFGIWIFDYGICIADFFYFGLWILLPIRQFLCCYIKIEILEEIGAIILWTKHGRYSKDYSLRKRVGPFLSYSI